jgi:predicted transcriptional regulator YheO
MVPYRRSPFFFSAFLFPDLGTPMKTTGPDIPSERQQVLAVLKATLSAMGSVVGRNTEIVLHDLVRPERSVLDIVNGHVTGRSIGSPVLSGPLHDQGFAAVACGPGASGAPDPVVIPDYPTMGANGHALRSATVVFRDKGGQPFAGLCINVDVSGLLAARACLEEWLNPGSRPEPRIAEPADMEVLMAEIIRGSMAGMDPRGKAGNKPARLEAVRQMQERGLFIVKGGIEKAAAALGVTRYTIYNYLDEIGKRSAAMD